jgi:hypothetical protein
MSETQFTRLDWRPSRKRASRPRSLPWGGQKQAPAAFLAAARASGFGTPGNDTRCAHCRRFAMRESGLCRFHNGPRLAMAARPYVKRPVRLEPDCFT